MDKIEIQEYQTRYAIRNHPMIFVNGKSLDELLLEHIDDEVLLGLIPSITWLWDDGEHQKAVERFVIETIGSTAVPILVCPDDADFSCTVLIVEVEFCDEIVKWSRFGLDRSTGSEIATTVDWFKNSPGYSFRKSEYLTFRDELVSIANEL